ncbi:MAG: hypothetical protein ABSD31_09125 [Candidatus Binataceae bacterium]|jgi:hypothetical protein
MKLCRSNRVWFVLISALLLMPWRAIAADGSDPAADPKPTKSSEVRRLRAEIEQLRQEDEQKRKMIDALAKRVDQLEADQKQAVQKQEAQIESVVSNKMQEQQVSPTAFSGFMDQYLGSHTFTVTGAAGFNFIVDQQSYPIDAIHNATQNSFFFDWEPMILYRPADWILFEGVISTSFGEAGTGVDLSTADFQLFLNDYVTVVGGVFDNPFGDWYEAQSPMWVNRFVTAPLPFGVEAVVPPGEIGIQLRGGLQWGEPGQDVDYTIWTGNGPTFSEPIPGAAMGGPISSAFAQSNGKSIGGRLRVYPIPVDANLGRLELGASTYDGKWMNGHWLTSWGVDFNYFNGSFQARGEWLESYRAMQAGFSSDNRQGWYVQLGYTLNQVNLAFLPDPVNDVIHKLQPLVRYSGVNQHAVAIDDITGATGVGVGGIQTGLVPDFGISGSPALWAPHSREVALALDYYFTPSIVWENEFDIELPRAGGVFVAADGTTTPVGSTPNDHAFLSQFTVGF